MELEAHDDLELNVIKAKIRIAQKWAVKHFNAKNAKTVGFLDPPAFFVEFPQPDTMLVTPSFGGHRGDFGFMYRLCFKPNGSLEWHGTHPLYSTPTRPLVVDPVGGCFVSAYRFPFISRPFKGSWYYELQVGPFVIQLKHDREHQPRVPSRSLGSLSVWIDPDWWRSVRRGRGGLW